MGLDMIGLNLCRILAARPQGLGAVLTIGRQETHVDDHDLKAAGLPFAEVPPYCEAVLERGLGATSVTSLDASAYEGATLVVDLNRPLPDDTPRDFDTVLDLGTTEHVFDVRQAFENLSALCRTGGAVAHAVPANQQNGHGFFQFSPELFHTYYSPRRGYQGTRVFVVPARQPDSWYEVPRPPPGGRVNITSRANLYVVSVTTPARSVHPDDVQQSDYQAAWSDGVHDPLGVEAARARRPPMLQDLRHRLGRSHAVRRAYFAGQSWSLQAKATITPVVSDVALRRWRAADLAVQFAASHDEPRAT